MNNYNKTKEKLEDIIYEINELMEKMGVDLIEAKTALNSAKAAIVQANDTIKPVYNYIILNPDITLYDITKIHNVFKKQMYCEADRYSLVGEFVIYTENMRKFLYDLPKIDYVIMVRDYKPSTESEDNLLKAVRDILYYQDGAKILLYDSKDQMLIGYPDMYPKGIYSEMKERGLCD